MNFFRLYSSSLSIKKFVCFFFILYSLFVIPSVHSNDQNNLILFEADKLKLKAKILYDDFRFPWSLVFLPDGRILVTEKPGNLRIIERDFVVNPNPISGLPRINYGGQGGLFDIAIHPKYENNKWIYFSYSGLSNGVWGTELARARLNNNTLNDLQVIFTLKPKTKSNYHFGGKIIFDDDMYIYLSTGDRGEKNNSQIISNHAGSIIKIHDDGKIPNKNPFYNSKNSMKEIFSFGHRNIQGIAFHPETRELWANEHGPQGGDELNLIKAGSNYGWPVITFGVNYGIGTKIGEGTKKPGMENPKYKWIPSIATSGMTFITNNHFKEWKNDLLIASLKAKKLIKLEIKDNFVKNISTIFENLFGRIRNVKMGPDGFIYILTDERHGKLIQISKQ